MIIVDDRHCYEALAGRLHGVGALGPVATTWCFHCRLVRAITDERRAGRFTRAVSPGLQRVAISPPAARLLVLDPRAITGIAAVLARRHRLNQLAAELVGAALHHGASVMLSPANVGREWPAIFEAEQIEFTVR